MADTAARAIAERFRVMQPSATVENTERIRAARASGRRILGLSSGDPNIATDPRIIAAAERAMRSDKTHYSAPAGEPELRTAIAGANLRVIIISNKSESSIRRLLLQQFE